MVLNRSAHHHSAFEKKKVAWVKRIFGQPEKLDMGLGSVPIIKEGGLNGDAAAAFRPM